jgi:hypothetical protein
MVTRIVRMRGPFGYEDHHAVVLGDHLGVAYLSNKHVIDSVTRQIVDVPPGFSGVLLRYGIAATPRFPSLYEAIAFTHWLAPAVDWTRVLDDKEGAQKAIRARVADWLRAGGWLGQQSRG